MSRSLTFFLGTPGNQLQAHLAAEMPVLVSYAASKRWLERSWMHAFNPLLLDSGAFSELNSGVTVDLAAYIEWVQRFPNAVAWAGLDDIRGDWRRSLRNYGKGGFPTFHDSDPPELLDDLIPIAQERGDWLGVGLMPPRTRREEWLRRTLDRIPDEIHVHGWALGRYAHLGRLDSVDSTNWLRDVNKLLTSPMTAHLTPGEALEIIVKRYHRSGRRAEDGVPAHPELFDGGVA